MAKRRTTKKRLDVIEKDLGDVNKQVTNDIPHALDDLKESNVSLYGLVNENAKINSKTLDKAMRIIEIMAPYTHFRDTE